MLLVCGLYQLFGKFFKTKDGEIIKGIGVFDIETHGSNERHDRQYCHPEQRVWQDHWLRKSQWQNLSR